MIQLSKNEVLIFLCVLYKILFPLKGDLIMQQSLELFLLAAEELNFSKAAKRAFVTQQCLSDHIKRLEQSYGTPLFYRKPTISLTPYGLALQAAVQNIKLIETNLTNEFRAISNDERGEFNFGINATRARTLFPKIYPPFYERYPQIRLNVRINETRSMESLLLNGNLDMCLGIDSIVHPRLASKKIALNPLYCVMSTGTFAAAAETPHLILKEEIQKGIDLSHFQEIPFLLCLPESTTRNMIETSLSQQNIFLKNTLSISDYETHFDLCAQNCMATICPSAALESVIRLNRLLPPKNQLLVFPVRDLVNTLNIYLIYQKDLRFTGYMNYFVALLIDEILKQEQAAKNYVSMQTNLTDNNTTDQKIYFHQ